MIWKRLLLNCLLLLGTETLTAGTAELAESPWGICSHLQRWEYPEADVSLQVINKTGIAFVRSDLDWDGMEIRPGVWDFSRWDNLVALAARNNVAFCPILGYSVKWANPGFKHPDQWFQYVDRVVKRYGGRMSTFEIWNEPNLNHFWAGTDPRKYGEFLAATAKRIKTLKPDAKIIYGGTAGIPISYIEKSFEAGAAQAIDIMNVHSYQWRDWPETAMPSELRGLRRLMKKYGIADKPIWVTETGNSTGKRHQLRKTVLPLLLEEMQMNPAQTTAVVFRDSEYCFYTENYTFQLKDELPELKTIRGITLSELASLPANRNTLLILPPTEFFPCAFAPALAQYLRRGGRVLSPGGLPLYFNLHKGQDNSISFIQVNDQYLPPLHIGWEAFWTHKHVPRSTQKCELAPKYQAYKTAIPETVPSYRFFNTEALKPGDRLEPILYGTAEGYKGVLAGVYHFDSDLTGKFAVYSMNNDGNEVTSEDFQALLLPRTMLIALTEGVDRIFWFSFRSGEWASNQREGNFGIVSKSFRAKPALAAYRTLTALLPPGATRPVIRRQQKFFIASWQKKDGEKIHAFWTLAEKLPVQLQTSSGTLKSVVDLYGNPIADTARLTAGPQVIYVVGPDAIALKNR